MSNQTKMTREMREELDEMRESQENVTIFKFPDVGVTVAIRNAGNSFADIATAYQAADETKYRKNVGEYLVRMRLEDGTYTRVKLGENNYEFFAGEIANMAFYVDN